MWWIGIRVGIGNIMITWIIMRIEDRNGIMEIIWLLLMIIIEWWM